MGEAAKQRQLRRMKYLAELAKTDPARFDSEWEKRLSSWLGLIQEDAGRLRRKTRDGKEFRVGAVFERVEVAMETLRGCGKEVYDQYADETFDLLTGACCRHLAGHAHKSLYRLNYYLEPVEQHAA